MNPSRKYLSLGEPRATVEREYGSPGHGYHVIVPITEGLQGYYMRHGGEDEFVSAVEPLLKQHGFAPSAPRLARARTKWDGNVAEHCVDLGRLFRQSFSVSATDARPRQAKA